MTDSETALYLDRRLSPEERERIEDHLAHCRECRENTLAAQHILRRERRRPRLLAAGGALAAAAVVMIWIAKVDTSSSPGPPQLRGVTTDASGLTAYGPMGDARRENLRIVWGAAPGAVSYRLNLTSADGVQVWSQSGVDTVAVVPRAISLQAGQTYMWVADAILTNGATRSTGLRQFTLVQ